jgi:hypothetical protein
MTDYKTTTKKLMTDKTLYPRVLAKYDKGIENTLTKYRRSNEAWQIALKIIRRKIDEF